MGNRPWPIPRSLPVCPDPARIIPCRANPRARSEEHTSELQSQSNLVCRLLLEKKKKNVLITGFIYALLVVIVDLVSSILALVLSVYTVMTCNFSSSSMSHLRLSFMCRHVACVR